MMGEEPCGSPQGAEPTRRCPCSRVAAVLLRGLTVNKGRLCKNLVLYVHMRSVVHSHDKK